MFGSTYICDFAFSKINYIKSTYRPQFTNEYLGMTMKIMYINHILNFKQLIEDKKCYYQSDD